MSADLTPATRLHASSSVYARPFGAEIVLLDFGRGEYFALDEIGAEIWQHLQTGESLGTIAERIASRYEVTSEQALTDILAIVHEMCGRGIVEVDDSAAPP